MRLSKLRLVGFKSFVDSSEVLIEPGLTAIVGPNGCGKSNLVEALFARQRSWAGSDNPEEALFQMARQAGFTRDGFNECLTNQEILDGVNWVRERGAEQFDVQSTPTFFINGEMVRGAVPFSEFQQHIEAHLG